MTNLIEKVFDLVDEESGYYALTHKCSIKIAKTIISKELIAQINAKLLE